MSSVLPSEWCVVTALEPPPLAESAKDYSMRLSCCWFGDKRIVHAARSNGIWVGRSTACGHWIWDKAIRRDGWPGRLAKPVSCPECVCALAQLLPCVRGGAD